MEVKIESDLSPNEHFNSLIKLIEKSPGENFQEQFMEDLKFKKASLPSTSEAKLIYKTYISRFCQCNEDPHPTRKTMFGRKKKGFYYYGQYAIIAGPSESTRNSL